MFKIFSLETYALCEFDATTGRLVDSYTGEVYFETETYDEIEMYYNLFCFLRENKKSFELEID